MALSNFYLTDRGNELMARTLTGEKITITRAQIGEGTWPDGTTYGNITALVAPVKYLAIAKKTTDSHGQTKVTIQFTTDGIGRPFHWTELGLWAANPASPDDRTQDILMGTSRALSEDEAVPFDGSLNEFNFNIILKTSSADAVEVKIDTSAVYVSIADLDDAVGEALERQKNAPNGIAGLDANGGLAIKQVENNGAAHLFKNHSEAADYGTEVRDIDKDGDVAGILMNASQQTIKAKFTQGGVTSVFGLLHTGMQNIPETIGALATGVVTNIDSIPNEGFFNVMGFAAGTFPPELNELTTDTRYVGVIIHKVWDGNYAEQIFFSYATLKVYHRALRENIWTQWDNFLSFRGDTAIEGMLHVNNGSGRVFSWADADYFGAAIDSVRNETVGRLEVLTREDKAQGYVSFFNGSAWHSFEIYHEGNAPYEVATAELI